MLLEKGGFYNSGPTDCGNQLASSHSKDCAFGPSRMEDAMFKMFKIAAIVAAIPVVQTFNTAPADLAKPKPCWNSISSAVTT